MTFLETLLKLYWQLWQRAAAWVADLKPEDYFILLGSIATLAGSIIIAVQLLESVRESRVQTDRARKEATISFYSSTITPRSAWHSGLPDDRDPAAIAKFLRQLERMRPRQKAVQRALLHSYLSYWELIATGAECGVLNEQVLRTLVKNRVISIVRCYKPFIDAENIRLQYPDSDLYSEIRSLARRWEQPAGMQAPARPG